MPLEPVKVWPFTFDNIMEDFMKAPDVLQQCAEFYFSGTGKQILEQAQQIIEKSDITRIVFIGNSFNFFATHCAKYELESSSEECKYSWKMVELTEFYDYFLPQEATPNTLYIFISRSGQSRLIARSIEQLHLVNHNPTLIWMITNNPATSLNSYCKLLFPMKSPSEIISGSKSFMNSLLVVFLIAQLFLDKEPWRSDVQSGVNALINNLNTYAQTWDKRTNTILDFMGDEFRNLYIIARDPSSLSTAYLGALHAKTFTKILTEGIYISHFFHGPYQMLDKKEKGKENYVRFIVLVGDKISDRTELLRLLSLINDRGGEIVLLSNDPQLSQAFSGNQHIHSIDFDSPIPALAPIFEFFILQILLARITQRRGMLLG
jgi:fructoselysine-6-P-deglycase FrlB-like protein